MSDGNPLSDLPEGEQFLRSALITSCYVAYDRYDDGSPLYEAYADIESVAVDPESSNEAINEAVEHMEAVADAEGVGTDE